MILKDKQHAVVVVVTDVYLAPTDAVKQVVDRGHAHRIGNYVFEFHDGKGDHAAIRQCIREAPNDVPPGASDGRSPLMICLEATGLTPKPLSTADHMIFMDDDGDLVVKIVLGEALANETMNDPIAGTRSATTCSSSPAARATAPRSATASRRTSSLDPHPGQRGWASNLSGALRCNRRATWRLEPSGFASAARRMPGRTYTTTVEATRTRQRWAPVATGS